MNNQMTLAARLHLESRQWMQGLSHAQQGTRGFVNKAKSEFAQLRGFMDSTTGTLAKLGLGFGAVNTIMSSAKTDQALTHIRQTADLSIQQVAKLRIDLHSMAQETGISFDSLRDGFGQLAAGGLAFDQALPTIDAINKSMRVTSSEATTLAEALQSAQANFGFDLTKPGQSLELLDKMTVAGRAGVVEIEHLAGVFGTAASEAKAAGLTFDQTLALFEGMGTLTTRDRVGTLVASTLRLFTNNSYMREAQKATKVDFFDSATGARRNPLDILTDIKAKYDKLETEKEQFAFISRAFGKADLDTIKGIYSAMADGRVAQIRDITAAIGASAGTTVKDLPEAMSNSVAQAGVLRQTLATVGDQVSMPINKALADTIQKLTGSKESGGLGLDGWDLIGGGVLAAGGAYAGGRAAKGALGKILQQLGGGSVSLGAGVVAGQALQQAGAATPVYLVGAAPGLFSGLGGNGPLGGVVGDGKKGGKSGGAIGGVLSGLLTRAAAPALLASYPLSRYVGTLRDGMDDPTLQADVQRTLGRSRGRGLLAS
ncbi:phage tail tape measure protein, partial [Stenotrophomonas maltophilia]|nr:phage tail tape measure protein [Stenotrophomonas maltophilia]